MVSVYGFSNTRGLRLRLFVRQHLTHSTRRLPTLLRALHATLAGTRAHDDCCTIHAHAPRTRALPALRSSSISGPGRGAVPVVRGACVLRALAATVLRCVCAAAAFLRPFGLCVAAVACLSLGCLYIFCPVIIFFMLLLHDLPAACVVPLPALHITRRIACRHLFCNILPGHIRCGFCRLHGYGTADLTVCWTSTLRRKFACVYLPASPPRRFTACLVEG